jgi:hypothetical protein
VKNDQPLYSLLTQEEHQAVIDKMKTMVQLPAGHMPREEELYLEQQLTDLFGFEVAAELEETRLPHTIGVMAALPHTKRHPADELHHHDTYREAGLNQRRSSFGWFTEMGQLTPQAVQREKYHIAAQFDMLPSWQKQSAELKEWLKYRKLVVINPHAHKAVVVVVGDIGPADWLQEQFGGSPEVIREGEIWSLSSQGKVLVFFVNDPEGHVPLGVIHLSAVDI